MQPACMQVGVAKMQLAAGKAYASQAMYAKNIDMLAPQDFVDILSIARERSLKAAASALGIDPSTMGRRLDSIEARFGAPLFLRTAAGLELTREGGAVKAAA